MSQDTEEVARPLRASGPPGLIHAESKGLIESRRPTVSAKGDLHRSPGDLT